jgi:flagellar biosynthesis chaperone FliJ
MSNHIQTQEHVGLVTMKEGYLQLKIAELHDQCLKIEQLLALEDTKLQTLQDRVGGFKNLIKKLQDLEDYKKQMLSEIKDGNEQMIIDRIQQVSHEVSETLQALVEQKTRTIDDALKFLGKREKELTSQDTTLKEISKNVSFLLEHNELLMMKLVNKNVLSGYDVTEMQRRAAKKAETEKE